MLESNGYFSITQAVSYFGPNSGTYSYLWQIFFKNAGKLGWLEQVVILNVIQVTTIPIILSIELHRWT